MRKRLIRASGLSRVFACPGSWQAEDGLPNPENEYSKAGAEVHAWLSDHYLEAGAEVILPAELVGTAQALKSETDSIIRGIAHKKIWCEVGMTWNKFSGHLDFFTEIEGGGTMLLDWKSGKGYVPQASVNPQLRAYCVLLANNGFKAPFYSYIVQVGNTSGCVYDESAVKAAEKELKALARKAISKKAERVPSNEGCQYCKALGTERCPETLHLPAKVAELLPSDTDKIKGLTVYTLSNMLNALNLIDKLALKIKAEAKERLTNGQEIPEWRLIPGYKRRNIVDYSLARAKLRASGVDVALIDNNSSLSLTGIVKTYPEAEQVLGECVSITEGESRLTKEKP